MQDATNSNVWQGSKVMTHLERSVAVLEDLRTFDDDLDWPRWFTDGPKWAAQTSVPDQQVVRHEGGFAAKTIHDKQLRSVGIPTVAEMVAVELPRSHLMVHIVSTDGGSDQVRKKKCWLRKVMRLLLLWCSQHCACSISMQGFPKTT